jgi:hypothetical protein
MRGAFEETYIRSAVSEKLSTRARLMYACQESQHRCSTHRGKGNVASQMLRSRTRQGQRTAPHAWRGNGHKTT